MPDGNFKLTLELGNDAMRTHHDIAKALRKVAEKLDSNSRTPRRLADGGTIMDENGNTVGRWEMGAAVTLE